MKVFETDILIIGAGPAGTTASVFLSKAGIKHTIIDKATFPRDKICGDALSGKVNAILNRIDPALVYKLDEDPENYTPCSGVTFIAPNGKSIDIPFRKNRWTQDYAPGFIAKRTHFDNFLFNQIDTKYATVMLGLSVRDVVLHNEKVEVIYENGAGKKSIYAQMVIGAEGDRSVVAKKLANHKMDPRYYAAGLRAYYENVTGMHPDNHIELHYIKEMLPGYLWVFPLPDNQANVGVGLLSEKIKTHKYRLKEMMLQALETNKNLKERFKKAKIIDDIKGWGLPLGSIKRNLSGDRFLLVGDAASLIDPFTGEGIGNAMVSGMIAGKIAAQAAQKNTYSAEFFKEYDRLVYEKLWDELKLSFTIQRLLKYPWLFNFVANRASNNTTIRETMSCMFDDLNMRAKLKSPSFYFKLLFNN